MIKEIEQDPFINNMPFSERDRKGLKYGRYMRSNMNLKGCIDNAYKVIIKQVWQ